jgi:UDP-sugar diphosphatase
LKSKIPKILEIKRVKEPHLFKVYRIKFKENDRVKVNEARRALEIVKILIYNRDKRAFVIIRQFRPCVYLNSPESSVRYELCGGRVNKNLSIEDTAKEEVFEEVGYRVDRLEKITTLVDFNKIHIFYAEVDETQRVTDGGGIDDENIETIYLSVDEAKAFIFDEEKPKRVGLAFSICWWFSMRGSSN